MPIIKRAIDAPGRMGTMYPRAYAAALEGRVKRALTGGLGLTQFGMNLTTLAPGAQSSQRHWHRVEDECVYVLDGEVVLITEQGEDLLQAGDCAGFPAGDANGHCLVNRSDRPASYLEIGTRALDDDVTYPDIDMLGRKRGGAYQFVHRDGTPYGEE